jgi:hypothetical protein
MFSETNETINISGEGLVTPTAKPESMPRERSYSYIQNLKEDDIQLCPPQRVFRTTWTGDTMLRKLQNIMSSSDFKKFSQKSFFS